LRSPAHLKLELSVRGIRVEADLAEHQSLIRQPSARDHQSREIQLVLPEDIVATCMVTGDRSSPTPYELRVRNDRFQIVYVATDGHVRELTPVNVLSQPRFYQRTSSLGTPMWKVGTVAGNYISIDPASTCGFATLGVACQFCTLYGTTVSGETTLRPVSEVLEVVRAAFEEGVAEFVYFNTGYFDSEDAGFASLMPYIDAVKHKFDTLVAVQTQPPRDNKWIDRTYAAGVDALCYNVELYDEKLLARYCEGRSRLVGRQRYYEALEYAAKVFPSGTVWSDLIVGLEPPESTRAGIDALTAIGVLPVLPLFRPLDESALRDHPVPTTEQIAPLYAYLYRAVREAKINVRWMRDLGYAVTPIEARYFAGDSAKLDVAMRNFYKSKIGSRAVRGLSKLRRRLRVREVSESFDASKL